MTSLNKKEDMKVSIIVPVKNAAAIIRDLLNSLMQVDYDKDKYEVIVVDGNSMDDTRKIVAEYPVKLIIEERPGLNVARNTGVKMSRYEILAFTDADCVVSRDWIKRIVDNFHDSYIGCVGGSVIRYNNDFLSQYADESIVPVMRSFKKYKLMSNVKPPIYYPTGCNMAFRRKIMEDVGWFDENIHYGFDENELMERICKKGYKIALDPSVLIKHKHRSTLKGLLKQMFRYGRGGGLLLKVKRLNSSFSKWILSSLLSFLIWLSLIALSIVTLSMNFIASLAILLTLILTPLFSLMTLYINRAIKVKDKRYEKIIIYPIIDILRALSFMIGIIYQLMKQQKFKRFA